MWLCLNNAFLSVVSKDCAPDELMVRARRKGDIERIFPGAKVTRYTKSDYLYRAPVKRTEIAAALAKVVEGIDYNNFKNSVEDDDLHDCYHAMWYNTAKMQNPAPYSGYRISAGLKRR